MAEMSDRTFKMMILTIVILPILGVITAIILLWNRYVFASDLILLGVFYTLSIFGIGIGYHRMLTHEGFKGPKWIRALFVVMGAMAVDGAPATWAATHIKHHAHSDEEGDPHSPLEGFWHAHWGWLFDRSNFQNIKTYAPHLIDDPVVMFVERNIAWFYLFSSILPFFLGGFTGLVWGGGVRIFLVSHVTWSVNSICHTFGKRAYETTDESRNNWLIGMLAFGEGWHNNHHAFPRNAFHGMKWYQVDFNGLGIRIMEKLGLVWDVQRVGQETLEAHQLKGKTMHENIQEMKRELGEFIDHSRHELDEMMLKLSPQKVAAVRMAHEKTMKRFTEIQLHMEKRRNMKKAAIARRRNEVAQLVAIAKQKMEMGAL